MLDSGRLKIKAVATQAYVKPNLKVVTAIPEKLLRRVKDNAPPGPVNEPQRRASASGPSRPQATNEQLVPIRRTPSRSAQADGSICPSIVFNHINSIMNQVNNIRPKDGCQERSASRPVIDPEDDQIKRKVQNLQTEVDELKRRMAKAEEQAADAAPQASQDLEMFQKLQQEVVLLRSELQEAKDQQMKVHEQAKSQANATESRVMKEIDKLRQDVTSDRRQLTDTKIQQEELQQMVQAHSDALKHCSQKVLNSMREDLIS